MGVSAAGFTTATTMTTQPYAELHVYKSEILLIQLGKVFPQLPACLPARVGVRKVLHELKLGIFQKVPHRSMYVARRNFVNVHYTLEVQKKLMQVSLAFFFLMLRTSQASSDSEII